MMRVFSHKRLFRVSLPDAVFPAPTGGVAHQASALRGSGEEEPLKRLCNTSDCGLSALKSDFHLVLFELLFSWICFVWNTSNNPLIQTIFFGGGVGGSE